MSQSREEVESNECTVTLLVQPLAIDIHNHFPVRKFPDFFKVTVPRLNEHIVNRTTVPVKLIQNPFLGVDIVSRFEKSTLKSKDNISRLLRNFHPLPDEATEDEVPPVSLCLAFPINNVINGPPPNMS